MALGTSGPYLERKPSCEASVQPVREIALYPLLTGSALASKQAAMMVPLTSASTGLCDYWRPHPAVPRLFACCSSAERFAYSFLEIPSRDALPCRSANTSSCRVWGVLTPPSECALTGAPQKKGDRPKPVPASQSKG